MSNHSNNNHHFQVGQKVVIVGVTDIDGDFVDAGFSIIDPSHEATMDWQDPPQTFIGQVGTVVEPSMNDYYDIKIHFDWMSPAYTLELPGVGPATFSEGACFKYADVMLYDQAVFVWLCAEIAHKKGIDA